MTLTIWCNANLPDAPFALLKEGTRRHRLIISEQLAASNLVSGAADPQLDQADVAFGQPPVAFAMACERLRWIHLNSAGYTRYDTAEFRSALTKRDAWLTNSSQVYAEPCAEHVVAFMMAEARQLAHSLDEQRGVRTWPSAERRAHSRLLTGQSVLLLGFGAIGRRIAEILAPFRMQITAVKRKPVETRGVTMIDESQLERALGAADHVINILPETVETLEYVDGRRFAAMKPGAIFYNIGRGTTVEQTALADSLQAGHLGAAYLDVTDPEPLPAEHRLWGLPNCYITPHTAGGHDNEHERLVVHFLDNLERFERNEPLLDRVI